ncbi:Leucine-rich repeat neuronal protein 2, partial [Gryllus bimaculatus]
MGKLVRVGGRSLETLTGLRSLVLADSPSLAEIEPHAFIGDISSPSKFPALEKLILRGNSLRTLHPIFLPSIDNLVEVDLRDNLWQCDCNLKWIITNLEPIISQNNPEMLLNV